MSGMLISYRYSLFAFFLVFNAIICSVAVWNHSIARALLLTAPVDIYLAAIGGLGVAFIIPITAVDMCRKEALTGRVWFELLWVGIFWVLELCGASAFTSLMPDAMCSPLAVSLQRDSCNSSRVLQAFTWLCTIMLLVYLLVLFVCALLHYDEDKAVWHSGVRFYPWFGTRASLGSAPSSPTKAQTSGPTWQRRSLKLAVPQPKRPNRPADLDLEAGPKPAVSMMQQKYSNVVSAVPQPVSSMYPADVAASLGDAARAPASTGATPPPLGDWPRSSRHQKKPSKGMRYVVNIPSPVPEVASPVTAPAISTTAPLSFRKAATPKSAAPSAPSRPTHPRRGSGSPTRRGPPPPLDLTRISAYNAIEERRKQVS